MILQCKLYEAGFCNHPEYVVTNKFSLRICKFPMICSLLHHPEQGYIIFDSGYCDNFFQASKSFPYSLYKMVTPVSVNKTFKELLIEDDINPGEIKYIFLSHFHADHISAIDDFPNAKVICSKIGYEFAVKQSGILGLTKGILPLLIERISKRDLVFIEDIAKPIEITKLKFKGIDLWGDGSILICPLPGHAIGQYGLFCKSTNLGEIFLVADAIWIQENLSSNLSPHWLTKILSHDDIAYRSTISDLRDLSIKHPEIKIIPSHCSKTLAEINKPSTHE